MGSLLILTLFLSLNTNVNPLISLAETKRAATEEKVSNGNQNSTEDSETAESLEEYSREPQTIQQFVPPEPDDELKLTADICKFAQNQGQCQQKVTNIVLERFKIQNEYDLWQLNHRRLVFQSYLIIDLFFLVLVMSIVGVGLYLSYLKFREKETTETKLSFAKGNLEINSNVIGLIILIVSVAFFYLYLTHVYPIKVVADSWEKTEALPR
ncbi:hypothetical protein [Lyngbya sp. PCC 8106]|uniref:hypothetical protein n=1 Tax=Lyngbya sp. (strain PCC 8106) TaxID=313612 RepID=UPI001E59932E|nr:hypothetical protein [Lyngbya sp. PCC 8106]